MTEFPDTRNSLLVRVKDPQNASAWEQFASTYQPVVYRLARRRGLQDADAQDLAQQVLIAVAGAIDRWQPSQGKNRFRHWLRRVIRNAAINALTRVPRDLAAGGTSAQELLLECPEKDIQLETQIESEYRRELFWKAAAAVREDVHSDTWEAFERTVLHKESVQVTADQFNKPVGAIYTARSRVMYRIRRVIQKWETTER